MNMNKIWKEWNETSDYETSMLHMATFHGEGEPGAGRSLLYIIIAVIILAIVYWAATSYWRPPINMKDYSNPQCPQGQVIMEQRKLPDICVPGSMPTYPEKNPGGM